MTEMLKKHNEDVQKTIDLGKQIGKSCFEFGLLIGTIDGQIAVHQDEIRNGNDAIQHAIALDKKYELEELKAKHTEGLAEFCTGTSETK